MPESIVCFADDPAWHDLFYARCSVPRMRALASYLHTSKETTLRLFHATDRRHAIMDQGLLPTTFRRRKSMQSAPGYVYLAVFPSQAEDFARMAYPGQRIEVYAVHVTVRMLKADTDQLRNQRMWSGVRCGDTLAESLAIAHTARVKGRIDPWRIRPIRRAAWDSKWDEAGWADLQRAA